MSILADALPRVESTCLREDVDEVAICQPVSMPAWSANGSSLRDLTPRQFGTHSLRRTKATMIYRKTGNLRAVQLLLGHSKIESTVRYLGIEVDDALAIAEQIEV